MMSAMASQITGASSVCLAVLRLTSKKTPKHALLAILWGESTGDRWTLKGQ